MAYSKETKEYAKELFLMVGPNGNHKYSLDVIVEKIGQKLDKNEQVPKRSTVNNWINEKDKNTKKSWKDIWKSGVRHGLEQANVDIENNLDAEEKIEFEIDNITRLRANNAIKIQTKFSKKLDNNEVEYQDIAEMKLSEIIFNNLNLEAEHPNNSSSNIDSFSPDEHEDIKRIAQSLSKPGPIE